MLRNRFGFVAAGGLAALAVTLAVPAIGQESRVAPGLGKQIEWLNGPVTDQFGDLKGRVIFIDLWGVN